MRPIKGYRLFCLSDSKGQYYTNENGIVYFSDKIEAKKMRDTLQGFHVATGPDHPGIQRKKRNGVSSLRQSFTGRLGNYLPV